MKENRYNIFISTVLVLSMLLSLAVVRAEEAVTAEKDDYTNLTKVHSYEKVRVVNSSREFFGDRTRLCRVDNDTVDGWVIYDTNNSRDVVVRACQKIVTEEYEAAAPDFYVSNDLEEWTKKEPSVAEVGVVTTYKVYDYTVEINRGWKYIKIVMAHDTNYPSTDVTNNIQINHTIINRFTVDYPQITAEINGYISEKNWGQAMEKANSVEDAEKKAEYKEMVKSAYVAELEECISLIENSSQGEDLETERANLNTAKASMDDVLTSSDEINGYEARIVKAYVYIKNWEWALDELETVTDELNKDELTQTLKDSYKEYLDGCISALENDPSAEELQEKLDTLDDCMEYFEPILGDDQAASEFNARIEALDESLKAVRIEAYRFEDNFDYAEGGLLSDNGWYADAELTEELSEDYIISDTGIFQKAGNVQMYKSFVVPMEHSSERDYYFSFEFSVGEGDGFAGLRLQNGTKYFGVKSVSGKLYPVLNFKQEVVGNTALPQSGKYIAMLKLSQGMSYLSVYPSDAYPTNEWEISGVCDYGTTQQEYITKDDYNSGNASTAPNALTASNVKEVNSSRVYFGDATRLCRIDAELDSYVTYNVETCKTLTVQACLANEQTAEPKFYVSDDEENWNEISSSREDLGTAAGYSYIVYNYTIDLNRQHKYVKILLLNDGTGNENNIQINHTSFTCVKNVMLDTMTEETVEVYSDCGISLYSITQEENYAIYTKEIETAVEKMVLSKKLEDIESAAEKVDALFECIYKDFAAVKVNGYLQNNKNALPVFDKVSIVGEPDVGSELVAKLIYTDVYGNYKESNIKWYLGDNLLKEGENFRVPVEYEGKTIRVEATVKNVFEAESEVKTAQIKINRNEIEESYGGGGSGGGGYKSNNVSVSAAPGISQSAVDLSNQNSFEDIKNHWAKEEIEKLVELNIINGIGNNRFAPDEAVTRAQFAAFIARLMNFEEKNTDSSFSDVSTNAWYNSYISYVFENNIMSGSTDGCFYPDRFITREEMAKVIAVVCAKEGKSGDGDEKVFNDENLISDWAKDYVKICADLEIINGMPDGSFSPKANATRAEAAVVLNRLIDLIKS